MTPTLEGMDETLQPPTPREAPRPARPDLETWRGDIRQQPPAWRRRPRSAAVRELWEAARPILAHIGEGRTWE